MYIYIICSYFISFLLCYNILYYILYYILGLCTSSFTQSILNLRNNNNNNNDDINNNNIDSICYEPNLPEIFNFTTLKIEYLKNKYLNQTKLIS